MIRGLLIWGGMLGLTAIILGAFGAHSLKQALPAESLESFNVGVRYQMYHALALLLLGGALSAVPTNGRKIAGYLILIGTLLFSVSIYILSTKAVHGMEKIRWIGPITPIGGLIMIIGWGWLLVTFFRAKRS